MTGLSVAMTMNGASMSTKGRDILCTSSNLGSSAFLINIGLAPRVHTVTEWKPTGEYNFSGYSLDQFLLLHGSPWPQTYWLHIALHFTPSPPWLVTTHLNHTLKTASYRKGLSFCETIACAVLQLLLQCIIITLVFNLEGLCCPRGKHANLNQGGNSSWGRLRAGAV